jgi:hypothetical protein
VYKVKNLIFILFCLISSGVFAQRLTISANVKDKETGEPLGFASVGVKGQPFGTISNINGEFDFHFPIDLRTDTLVISNLGYKNFFAPISSLLDNPNQTLFLEKSTIQLEEIVVSDTLTGADVLRIALSRIDQNYPSEPFLLEGFYRDIKKVGGTYISLLEAAVRIFDHNYKEPRNQHKLREHVRLIEVRRSMGYESKFTTYFDQANLLEDLLLENSIRYRHIDPDDEYLNTVRREKNTFYNDHEIYVVTSTHEGNLKVYVDKEDFSIVHLEFETTHPSMEIQKKKNLISKFVGSRKSIGFKKYNGKMYPNFIEMNTKIDWFDVGTGQLKFETELFQQLLINNVNTPVDQKIVTTEKMRNYGLQYQDRPYNKSFWDNYNVIKETPIDKKILEDLEKVAPLEEQFADY